MLKLNPSSPKGGCNNPLTVFGFVLKIAEPRGKLLRVPSSSSFPFILVKKIPNLPPTPGVG